MDVQLTIKSESPKIRAKLPQHYHQIYTSYTSHNYEKCLEVIAEVDESHVEYSILKSACLIHLGKDISLAHEILDKILDQNPNNSYTVYAKGLAFYHEEKWKEAVDFFERARQLDPSPDLERAEIMKIKAMEKIADEQEPRLVPVASALKSSPQETGYSPARRFGCEICGHFFGKKFNLDRHNRSIHRRNTPVDFPQNSPAVVEEIEEPTPLKSEPMQDSAISVTFIEPEPTKSPVAKKKRAKPNSLNLFGSKNRAKCPHCKKLFRKGSLARHMIIHTGKKHHECSTCHRSFFQRSDLIRHETIHSDVLAFECELCSKKFRLKKNMQVHKRRHHFTVSNNI